MDDISPSPTVGPALSRPGANKKKKKKKETFVRLSGPQKLLFIRELSRHIYSRITKEPKNQIENNSEEHKGNKKYPADSLKRVDEQKKTKEKLIENK